MYLERKSRAANEFQIWTSTLSFQNGFLDFDEEASYAPKVSLCPSKAKNCHFSILNLISHGKSTRCGILPAGQEIGGKLGKSGKRDTHKPLVEKLQCVKLHIGHCKGKQFIAALLETKNGKSAFFLGKSSDFPGLFHYFWNTSLSNIERCLLLLKANLKLSNVIRRLKTAQK